MPGVVYHRDKAELTPALTRRRGWWNHGESVERTNKQGQPALRSQYGKLQDGQKPATAKVCRTGLGYPVWRDQNGQ